MIVLGTGSEVHLCVRAQEILAADGVRVRVVSMPCWEGFERQDADYRDLVLPPEITARVAVEAGVPLGWHRYVGRQGAIIAMQAFGESAPAKVLADHFGFTAEHVADVCRAVMNRPGGPSL